MAKKKKKINGSPQQRLGRLKNSIQAHAANGNANAALERIEQYRQQFPSIGPRPFRALADIQAWIDENLGKAKPKEKNANGKVNYRQYIDGPGLEK